MYSSYKEYQKQKNKTIIPLHAGENPLINHPWQQLRSEPSIIEQYSQPKGQEEKTKSDVAEFNGTSDNTPSSTTLERHLCDFHEPNNELPQTEVTRINKLSAVTDIRCMTLQPAEQPVEKQSSQSPKIPTIDQ